MQNRFTALPENEIARPTPAVVIAVGRFAAQSARQVQNIYLRGDARRAAASAFYQLMPDDSNGFALAELVDQPEIESESSAAGDYLQQRQASLHSAIQNGSALKTRLESLLHEQRVHENLIEAGWTELYDVPLNFFILADLNDPWTSGILLPLGAILNELVANTSLCQAHWMLGTGIFPESAPDQDMNVWSSLLAFDDFLSPDSKYREALARELKIQYQQTPDFSVYLFDSRKEGTAMVKDPTSLNTLLGNALLALLQRDLARRFHQERDEDALIEHSAYYSSIGAAALVYDPESLQTACASRLGYIFLREKILCAASDGQKAIEHAVLLQEKIGGIYNWLESLSGQLPPSIGQVRIQHDTLEMTALLTDISLFVLDYERVQTTPWAVQLQSYNTRFQEVTMKEVDTKLAANAELLQTRLAEILRTAVHDMPLEADLCPGGLNNTRSVLELTSDGFGKSANDLNRLTGQVQEHQSAVADKLATQSQHLQSLLSNAPTLPWWIRILPAFARRWLAPLYMLRHYGRQLYLAQSLRDECLILLQQLCGLRVEQLALEFIKTILPGLQVLVQDAQTDLVLFEEKLTQAMQTFSPEWDEFPLAATANGWDELFRQPIVERCLATWSFDQWRPELDGWVHDFLATQPMFTDWRSVESDAITEWVKEQAIKAYYPVWSLDLDAIFGLWATNTPGFTVEKPLSGRTITTCMGIAIPPIRPDFDAVGGSYGSGVTFHGLTSSPDWVNCCLPPSQNGLVRWQAIYTGDPYTALFIQVCRSVPLRSLVDSFQLARLKLDGLPSEHRRVYDLLRELDRSAHLIQETVDPHSPDLVHKTYQWKFQPKGSSKEFEQTIELSISRSRFEYYRRQERLNGQWNVYAELEMPEVRELATEFQKLHALHKWSTFNQAHNVLKFVQNCISYSYDKETTGHEDWARYPIETLMEGTGDCEDVSILCASVISRLGFQAVLLAYPKHLAFGVAGADNLRGEYIHSSETGLRYYYGEATANRWHLGEIPREYMNSLPKQILTVNILIQEDDKIHTI